MSANTKLYPIQIVARRTGLNVDLLRAWERRYSVVEPDRSDGGRRLYSAADIERLSLLGRAVDRGLRIGDARRMNDAALRAFLAEHDPAQQPESARATAQDVRSALEGPGPGAALTVHGVNAAEARVAAAHLGGCKHAVESFDSAALARSLSRANVALSLRALVDDVVTPLLAWIGARWSEGSLCVAQEHMASAAIRSTLLADLAAGAAGAEAPCVIVTTPALELHEIGALLAALAAMSVGWRVEYLGPNLPAGEIALAARRYGAQAIALSVARPVKGPSVGAELKELRKLLPKKVSMLVGGSGAAAYEPALQAVGALRFDDCWSFARHLESEGGASK
jgi:MerR family transcriptional regulator, light-induced transcriptional regulator